MKFFTIRPDETDIIFCIYVRSIMGSGSIAVIFAVMDIKRNWIHKL